MESTTPTSAPPHSYRTRSTSRTRNTGREVPSRPTTPLRASSRTSLRASTTTPSHSLSASSGNTSNHNPLDVLEPAFAEFSDSMADLEANMLHLQLLQESLSRFNENFGSLLYGLNMNAFTVDFTEAPGTESFRRQKDQSERDTNMFGFGRGAASAGQAAAGVPGTAAGLGGGLGRDVDATFLTSDTSFVENPPTPRTTASSRTKMAPAPPSATSSRTAGSARGASGIGRGASSASTRGRGRGPPVVRGTRATQMAASRRETIAARGRGTGSSIY